MQDKNIPIGNFKIVFSSLLKEKGVTQAQLSTAVGLSQSAISKYLKGRIPNTNEAVRIAKFFGVTVEFLFGEEVPSGQRSVSELLPLPPSKMTKEEANRAADYSIQLGFLGELLSEIEESTEAVRKAIVRHRKACEAYNDRVTSMKEALAKREKSRRKYFPKKQAN